MAYYLNRTIAATFDDAVARVFDALKAQGFGVLTDIDVQDTMKKKLNAAFRPYRILGACNPPLALRALEAEDKIGTMLPCNVIVQELGAGKVEVATIDPEIAMQAVGNPALSALAAEVRGRLQKVLDAL